MGILTFSRKGKNEKGMYLILFEPEPIEADDSGVM